MYKINEFSKFAKISARMLRYYDKVGLFKPAKIDQFTGYRYYSAYQIPKLVKIITLRDSGFNVDEITYLIECKDNHDFLNQLKLKQKELLKGIEEEKKKVNNIDNIISIMGKDDFFMKYEVKLKEIPTIKVVSTRAIVKNYSNEIALWEKLGSYCINNELQPLAPPFAIYHDGEHKTEDVDIEVAMPISVLKDNEDSIIFREVSSIPLVASVKHKGSYENIDAAFFYLAKWIEDNRYEINGNVRHVSVKGGWNESDPANFVTEIQMPIKK
ncbi:MerR family transcriptional regulator [Clostridiaceae bacterium M8S5]|nr:MerR family transcriptional regulator [Clostridiaceae bacterium M8S5]